MTTVLVLARSPRRMRVEGILRWAVLVVFGVGLPAAAQERPVHWLNAGAMPPGAIGSLRLHRGGPLSGYFQPVRIRAPQGARIALAMEGGFSNAQSSDALVGMLIGPVYRLQVTDIPNNRGSGNLSDGRSDRPPLSAAGTGAAVSDSDRAHAGRAGAGRPRRVRDARDLRRRSAAGAADRATRRATSSRGSKRRRAKTRS